ncbi:endonuclease exonuclease phosphatase family domain containing protein [Musa troglodytarum]|uniref:Endonuclease exonuclease phosphatase family domain containing protein n=1 Tax=Musa troglodytarum TaxID=320322 RepID=A0A9E7K317_9LILI|nr:endonuclease exonuclease phosphatase family domain containing protein [Musa troglodytarum]
MTKSRTSDDSAKNDKKKKSILPSIFSRKGKNKRGSDGEIFPRAEIVFDLESRYISRTNLLEAYPIVRKSLSGRHTSSRIEGLNLSILEKPRRKSGGRVEEYRVFAGTWNVGGRSPNNGLNLEDFLQVEGSADIYVLGFQEIVPLNAGNVLVIEDNEPAAKWLALISHALNKPSDRQDDSSETWNGAKLGKDFKSSSSHLFQKPSSLKAIGKNCRVDGALVKTCNCRPETASGIRRRARKLREFIDSTDSGSDEEYYCHPMSHVVSTEARPDAHYSLVASKQMVGIFLSVWVRSELVPHVGHLRVATVGRGIMGCLGNKGCIAMSMSLHRTSFCFVCSHLTSGEKEGDELKRNADVSEILKSTQFPKVCKIPGSRIPEKILEHDRILWLGDLNYRIALSYNEARTLLEDNDWDSLLGRDQAWNHTSILSICNTHDLLTLELTTTVEDGARSGKGVRRVEGREDLLRSHVQVLVQLRRIRRGDDQVQEEAPNTCMVVNLSFFFFFFGDCCGSGNKLLLCDAGAIGYCGMARA